MGILWRGSLPKSLGEHLESLKRSGKVRIFRFDRFRGKRSSGKVEVRSGRSASRWRSPARVRKPGKISGGTLAHRLQGPKIAERPGKRLGVGCRFRDTSRKVGGNGHRSRRKPLDWSLPIDGFLVWRACLFRNREISAFRSWNVCEKRFPGCLFALSVCGFGCTALLFERLGNADSPCLGEVRKKRSLERPLELFSRKSSSFGNFSRSEIRRKESGRGKRVAEISNPRLDFRAWRKIFRSPGSLGRKVRTGSVGGERRNPCENGPWLSLEISGRFAGRDAFLARRNPPF